MKNLLIAILVLFGSVSASVSLASSTGTETKTSFYDSIRDTSSKTIKNLQNDLDSSSAILPEILDLGVYKAKYFCRVYVRMSSDTTSVDIQNKGSPRDTIK